MKQYLLSILIILNACSTIQKNTSNSRLIGPQLKLKGENNIEQWLKGEWVFSRSTDTKKTVYKYSDSLGKQELHYNQQGHLTGCMSYEIKENFFTNHVEGKRTITHLLVTYGFSEDGTVPLWNEQYIYKEIEKLNEDEYVWYIRVYHVFDTPADDLKNPRATRRMGNIATYMKRL